MLVDTHSRPRGPALFALLALAGVAACSSAKSASDTSSTATLPGAGAGTSEQVSCQADPRVSPGPLPLQQVGAQGYRVTLATRDPDPSAKGLNQWTVAVTDSAGAPVIGATLMLSTKMPDHGHSGDPPSATVTDAQGVSAISGLDFFMAGVWKIQIDLYAAGSSAASDPSDSVAFLFCVEG